MLVYRTWCSPTDDRMYRDKILWRTDLLRTLGLSEPFRQQTEVQVDVFSWLFEYICWIRMDLIPFKDL